MWKGSPVSLFLSVELWRFMPNFAAHIAVAFEPAPHQMRSRSPEECGSRRSNPGGFGNIGRGLGCAKPLPRSKKDLCMAPTHISICFALGRLIAEIPPSIDDLLGRPSAKAKLQAHPRDEIGRAGVFGHVEWVLIAHVDDGRAYLDAARFRADGCQQRER